MGCWPCICYGKQEVWAGSEGDLKAVPWLWAMLAGGGHTRGHVATGGECCQLSRCPGGVNTVDGVGPGAEFRQRTGVALSCRGMGVQGRPVTGDPSRCAGGVRISGERLDSPSWYLAKWAKELCPRDLLRFP